jgi:hypothetical protein
MPASGAVIGRLALIAGALVVAACLTFTLRAVRLQNQARAIALAANGHLTPAEVDRARSLLHKAERPNPDVAPKLIEALILNTVGRRMEAAALLRSVVHKEPDNVAALQGLQSVLSRYDTRAAAAVGARIREVAPPVGG